MANTHSFISRFQRNIERVRDLDLVKPNDEKYQESKREFIIKTYKNPEYDLPGTVDKRFPLVQNKENSFLDIGLFLDAIGGSRANSFFLTPFGYRNTGKREFNHMFSIVHKRILCAYGDNPYDFSSALSDICVFNNNRDYIVHSVSFNDHTANMVHNDFNPTHAHTRRLTYIPKYNMRELNYDKGIYSYLSRLQQFRSTLNEEIEKYGELVSNGRRAKIIFMFLNNEEINLINNDKKIYEDFWDIYNNGYKEKIFLVPCVKNIEDISEKIFNNADLIMAYGTTNSNFLVKRKVSTFDYNIEQEFNELKTVGTVFDIAHNPGLFPLDGLTEEFFRIKEELDEWQKEEDEKYISFLDSLDDGSKYDDYQDYTPINRLAFNRQKDQIELELRNSKKYKPTIEFL